MVQLIDKHDMWDECMVSSFNHDYMNNFIEKSDGWLKTGFIHNFDSLALPEDFDSHGDVVVLDAAAATEEVIWRVTDNLRQVAIYFNWKKEDEFDIDEMVRQGVTTIISDHPYEVLNHKLKRVMSI